MASGNSATTTVTIKDATNDSSINISVTPNTTVEELKKLYANRLGTVGGTVKPWNGYKFVYGSTVLSDASKLSSVSTYVNGLIIKSTFTEPAILVNVRGLDGRTKKITAYGSWTVKQLKMEYARWLGQGWDNVVMLYKAKRLKDDDLLNVYNIESEGFVQANIRSVGGGSTIEFGSENNKE